jgi:hypothetical protein
MYFKYLISYIYNPPIKPSNNCAYVLLYPSAAIPEPLDLIKGLYLLKLI